MIIKDNIKDILKQGTIQDNMYFLPKIQLDRKDYIECNSILEVLGLKWNKKEKAHIAEGLTNDDLMNALSDIYETGEVETLKDTIKKFQFYPTPKEVAEYLVELADVKESDMVCEPSAGLGNIAELIPECLTLTLIELDKIKAETLFNKFNKINNLVLNIDFLDLGKENSVDKFIMNPPFSKSQDVKHILKAYELLNEGGRIVSIASSSIQTREGKLYDELKALNPEFIELPEGSFRESGTLVNTVILVINK